MKIKGLIISLLVICFGMLACCGETESDELSTTFVTVSINPEVGLFLDKNEKVVDTIALNDDADVLLSDEDLNGKDVDEAVGEIVDESVNAGYLDSNSSDATVTIDVEGEDSTIEDSISEKIKKNINEFFKNNGIFGHVSIDTLDKYGELAEELNLSNGQTKMILLALELNPDLTIDDLKEMPVNELVKLCHKEVKNGNYGHKLNTEYKEAREALREEFALMFTLYDEIETLKNSIVETLTEDEKIAIQAQIDDKQAQYDELKVQYDERINALKEDYKTKKENCKEEFKNSKKDKEEKAGNDNKKHQNWFNGNKDKIKANVEAYQLAWEEYRNSKKSLKIEYQYLNDLKDEIEELKESLETELTETDLATINNTIVTKQATYDAGLKEYNEKLQALTDAYALKKDEIKASLDK